MADTSQTSTPVAPSLRRRVFQIVEPGRRDDLASMWFDRFIIALILLNIVAFIIETVEPWRQAAPAFFVWFEVFSVAIFTIEYLARLWSAVEQPGFRRPIIGRTRFALQPLLIIDLLVILPFYLPFIGIDLRSLRILRVVRIVRLAKLGRYSQSVRLIGEALVDKRYELSATFSLVLMLMLLGSSAIYFAEREVQPETFTSIPAAMWWAVATLTTVGYGDVYPVTTIGRVIGGICAITGIGLFALTTAVLGAGFLEAADRARARAAELADSADPAQRRCPHCHKVLDPDPEARSNARPDAPHDAPYDA